MGGFIRSMVDFILDDIIMQEDLRRTGPVTGPSHTIEIGRSRRGGHESSVKPSSAVILVESEFLLPGSEASF